MAARKQLGTKPDVAKAKKAMQSATVQGTAVAVAGYQLGAMLEAIGVLEPGTTNAFVEIISIALQSIGVVWGAIGARRAITNGQPIEE